MENHLLHSSRQTTDSHEEQTEEQTPAVPTEETAKDVPAELSMRINNVVSSFEVGCELNLAHITLNGAHTDYRDKKGMLIMKLLRPCVTAQIWPTGSINVSGATSEEDSKLAAHRFTRVLANMGYPTTLTNFRIVNVLGTSTLPWAVRIAHFSIKYSHICKYEPEVHPDATFTLYELNASAQIFANGSVTITANSVLNAMEALKKVVACCYEFRRSKAEDEAGDNEKISSHLNDVPDEIETSPNDHDSGTVVKSSDRTKQEHAKDEDEIQGSILHTHPKRFKRT